MGGIAPANQLRLSLTGSEDGEAETETCRVAKPLWRKTPRPSGPVRAQPYGTARCGPACRVVWQGRVGDHSPYADYGGKFVLYDARPLLLIIRQQ